jgi:hypothetical protein
MKKDDTRPIGVRVREMIWNLVCKEAKEKGCYPSDIVRDSLDKRYKDRG